MYYNEPEMKRMIGDFISMSRENIIPIICGVVIISVYLVFFGSIALIALYILILVAMTLLYFNYNTLYMFPDDDVPKMIPKQKQYPNKTNKLNPQKQVFNISDNIYSYKNAKNVCKAYGSRLATYKEIEDAYNKGGEWCNYGWSADQMILYPTQEGTYNELKQSPENKHDCGRPGINGGYIENADTNFGVNCYGYKPEITPKDEKRMEMTSIYPKPSINELKAKAKINNKSKLGLINVSPFNYTMWNQT